MNILSKLATVSALALLSLSAQAANPCTNYCEYVYYGRNLGDYWPGDHSFFGNKNIVADLASLGYGNGQATGINDWYVFDLNDNAAVTLTIDSRSTLAENPAFPPRFAVEIYPDNGSLCDGQRCTISVPDFYAPIVSKYATRKWTATTDTLPPGRYLIRVVGGTRLAGESQYTGMLRVRRLQGSPSTAARLAAARQGHSPQRW